MRFSVVVTRVATRRSAARAAMARLSVAFALEVTSAAAARPGTVLDK